MMLAARWPARREPANNQFDLLCMAVHKRSNWLFAGSLRAGQRAAAIMSLIQTAKLNGHDLYLYLRDVLERLPTHAINRIEELLPHRWKP
jgi:transposase